MFFKFEALTTMFSKFEALIDGKKSFIVSAIGFCAGIAMSQGVTIPPYIWVILASAGFGAGRSAAKKIESEIAEIKGGTK